MGKFSSCAQPKQKINDPFLKHILSSTKRCISEMPHQWAVLRISLLLSTSLSTSNYYFILHVSPAKSEGRTCEYNGRIYQNGESFRAGCKHQCSCIDGAVGCAPLCNNKLPPASPSCPYPRLVRIPGQCCFSVDCHKGTWRLPPKHQVCFWLKRVRVITENSYATCHLHLWQPPDRKQRKLGWEYYYIIYYN